MAAISVQSVVHLPPVWDADPYNGIRCATYMLSGASDADTSLYDAIYYTSDAPNDTVDLFSVPVNAIIHDFGWRVRGVFTASVTIEVGDSDDANGYAEAADIACTADGDSVVITTIGSAMTASFFGTTGTVVPAAAWTPAYASQLPKLCFNSDTANEDVIIQAVVGGADAATGAIEFFIWYSLPRSRRSS